MLGTAWDQLAPQIRQLHTVTSESSFSGRCTVDRGSNPLSWLVASLYGFPKAGTDQPIAVNLKRTGDGERWTRISRSGSFSSVQHQGRGASGWLVRERFGPLSVDMALVVEGTNLR